MADGPADSLNDNSYVAPHGFGETAVIDVFLGAGGVPTDDGDGEFTSRAWTGSERSAVEAAFAAFERVANVRFNLVSIIEEADFVMLKNDAEPDTGIDDETLGYWWIGGGWLDYGGLEYVVDGIGVFNSAAPSWTSESLVPGGYGFITLVHELGHGLGLKHPHDDFGGVGAMHGVDGEDDLGDFDLNQGIYTTMSYNDGWVTQPNTDPSLSDDYGWQSGLMALDIAMLQSLYGAVASETGDTAYTLPGTDKFGTSFQAIWDTGGIDTIRYTGSKDAMISLEAATLDYSATGGGVISYVKGVHGGFTIAHGVMIENAKAGKGDDWLQGNAGANRLDGGAGRDTVDYANRTAAIDLKLAGSAAGAVSVGGVAEDTLRNIENAVGGAAGDRLIGDSAGNWLTGGGGDDVLRGKGGHDRFVFATKPGAGNADTVMDFKHNTDVLALEGKIFKSLGSAVTASEFYARDGAHKAHDGSDRLVYDSDVGNLYYDADGKGGKAAVLFATLNHMPTLDHGDFLIV
jgi:Ca2+-binding RTX toxin-like protein